MISISAVGVGLAFVLIFLGLVVVALGARHLDERHEQERIRTFVIERADNKVKRGPAELEGRRNPGFHIQRTLGDWLNTSIGFWSRYAPPRAQAETNRRMAVAGNPFGLRARSFYGVRVLLMLLGAVLALGTYRLRPSPPYLLLALGILLLSLIAPSLWLRAAMRRRQDLIRRGLPDALDMLSVITAAGLGFDQAMLRLGQTLRTPVGQEFGRVVSEIEMGISRSQALRDMRARVDVPELSSFVAVILQSEQLGMSIADVLHSQAEQMRIYRQFRAKEIAQQLPARMMIPLVLFIFPALLAVILGPFFPVLLSILQ